MKYKFYEREGVWKTIKNKIKWRILEIFYKLVTRWQFNKADRVIWRIKYTVK